MENRDCSFLLEGADPSRILKKALVLLEHQITKENVNRQLRIINEYLVTSKNGFLVRDLSNVMHLVEIIRSRLPEEPLLQESMNKILNLFAVPPVLTRSVELIMFDMDLQEYFSWLGYLAIWLTKKYQMKIIEAIYKLTTQESKKRNYVSLEARKDLARASKLVELIGDMLDIVEEDLYFELLKIVQVLVNESKETCIKLVRQGVVNIIIVRLEPTWRERFPLIKPCLIQTVKEVPFTGMIFYILTTLLKHATIENMRAPSKFTLWSLQWAFRFFALKEKTNVDRNNVLAVLLLLMDIYPDLLVANLTFCYDIAMLAMSSDVVFHTNWTSNIKLSTSYEDHSGMALLLMCISYFPNCLSGPKVIEECRVVMGLLKVIGHQQAIKWHQLQLCYLIRLSLNILHKIIPASPEEFVEEGGPGLILQLLSRGRRNFTSYSYDIMFRSVALLSLLAYDFKSIRDSIAYNGGIKCILSLCEDLMKLECISEENQIFLAVAICLLDQICEVEDAYEILPLIISYMKRYVNPDEKEQIQIPTLMIICLSFVWNKIVPSEVTAQEFVKRGGVYLILDIVQMNRLAVTQIALGTIIDLSESVECIPYMITWRGNGQGITSLLMDIFRQENEQLFVKIDKNGIIINSLFPLLGGTQFYETYCSCCKHMGNAFLADLFVSCRPKVYCLLEILNSKQKETVETTNEFYKVYPEELSAIDEVTYVLAENFLALKMVQGWKEIRQEFKKMNLTPIPSDGDTLNAMIEIGNKWGMDLKSMQQEILNKHLLKQRNEEQSLYDTLRDSCLADAWDALSEIKYVARCSERLFRVTSNYALQSQIARSLTTESSGQLHKTLQSDISITCLHNQTIKIPNCVLSDINAAPQTKFVSPDSSQICLLEAFDEPEGEYLPEELLRCDKQLIIKK